MSRPRVLFVTTSFPSAEQPAAGIFVLEHARAVAPRAEIAVLHLDRRSDASGLSVAREEYGGFPLWRVRYPYRPTWLSVAAHVAAGLRGYVAVRRSGFEPDLVHAHFFLAALPAALLPGPLVASEHWSVFLPEDPMRLSLPLRVGARVALRRARVVMPVSRSLATAMRDAGIRQPFEIVPNAVDTTLFRPGEGGGGRRLATAGLLRDEKGIDVLLRALGEIRGRLPGVTLDVVGDGPNRAEYEQLARELGIEDAVSFRGFLPKPDFARILEGADLFVLASRFDNNPCVLLEAQAAGLPIVASRVGGIPDIVEDFGLLAAPEDVGQLGAGIEEALLGLDRFDRAAIAEHARERYGFDQVGESIFRVYERALAGRAAG